VTLDDLQPRWVGGRYGEPSRHGMGVGFGCPCCRGTARATRLVVYFANPVDGGPPADDSFDHGFAEVDGALHNQHPRWTRAGDTFETLTLTPSIDASAHGHWHGFITCGTIT
jgi:hypothetical protein